MATRSKKKCHPYDSGYPFEKIVIRFNSSGYPFKKKSSLQTVHYFSKPVSPQPFVTSLAKNVSLNDLLNSPKHSLPWPHEFSRYICRWVAFFITFDYRYNKFYSRLSYHLRARTLFWKKIEGLFKHFQRHISHYSRTPFNSKKDGGRYIIGRREKWPEKKSGRKYREEGENEILGVERYRRKGNFLAFL